MPNVYDGLPLEGALILLVGRKKDAFWLGNKHSVSEEYIGKIKPQNSLI